MIDSGAVGGVFGGVGASHGALYLLADLKDVFRLAGAAVNGDSVKERRGDETAGFGLNHRRLAQRGAKHGLKPAQRLLNVGGAVAQVGTQKEI